MNESQNVYPRKGKWNVRSVFLVALSALTLSFLLVTLDLFGGTDTTAASQPVTESIRVVEVAEVVTPAEQIPELPVRLVIPAIDVDAQVQHVGLDVAGTGEMAVPSNFTDVGWYKEGVRPGMLGSAVIAGHYNGKGIPEAVFYDLSELEVGDEIFVMSAEKLESAFVVVEIATYDYDAETTEIFTNADGAARLNLITCSGQWLSGEAQYNQRTVVFTELLSIGK